MPSETDLMSTSDANDAHTSKEQERECQHTTSGDEAEGKADGDLPTCEEHPPKELTERDLSIRMTLYQAGYDVSQLKPGAPLPEEAQALLTAKTTSTRVVMRSWPRDPKGQYIMPDNTQPGKTTSNGVQLWGATLLDFFYVRRIPSLAGLLTLTTGSKLAAWMKKYGEESYAEDEMVWAEREEEPREVPPCDIGSLIEPTDRKLALGLWGKSMPSKDAKTDKAADETEAKEKGESNLNEDPDKEGGEADKKEKKADGDGGINEKGNGKENGKENVKPFDASSYPAPWPLVPFSYPAPALQDYIPLNRLPKKLIVHDPWNLLSAREYWGTETGDWTTTPDITHVYELKLSPEALKRLETEAAEAAKEKAELEEKPGSPYALRQGFFIRPTHEEPGPIEPPVYVVYPFPPAPEPVEEAHLYISPAHLAGRGNHSIVYKAELEVPRSMLMPPTLCRECATRDVEEIIKEADGEDGAKKEARWKEKSAKLERVLHVDPAITLALMPPRQDHETKDGKPVRREVNEDDGIYSFRPMEAYPKMEFKGPVRPVETRVPWVSPDAPSSTLCSHMPPRHSYPPTTKVLVTAKLSLQYDRHLAVEADNYQKFPKHFFEHWNGLNLLPPLHDPTPVGAVVPQFYGHYHPVEPKENMEQVDTDANSDEPYPPKRKPYLSPIMLLEQCGEPLNPYNLTIDEKNECASLYYRFHHAGWVHRSIAPRNILVQYGPLTAPPFFRLLEAADGGGSRSFRVIDFGRSALMERGNERENEETEVAQLFDHMDF